LDVGRTLTRFNFPQTEVFNPLGILLARHLTQIDEAQRNATDGAEDNDAVGGEPRQEVADAILAISTTTFAREPPGPEPADDGEQGGENSGAGDGIFVRTFRSIDPNLAEGQIPIDSIRVDFTSGNLQFMTESTIDITFLGDGPSSAEAGQSSVTNTVAEDRAEVGTPTPLERLSEGTIIALVTLSERLTYPCIKRQPMHHHESMSHNLKIPEGPRNHLKKQPQEELLHRSTMTRTLHSRRTVEEESFGATRASKPGFDLDLHRRYNLENPVTTRQP